LSVTYRATDKMATSIMTPAFIYSLKMTNLLTLPKTVQDVISTMQVTPVLLPYVKNQNSKKFMQNKRTIADTEDNWRREVLVELKATIWNKDDPDYEGIIGHVNKVVVSNLSEKVNAIYDILKKRQDDKMFRMRAVNLMFDRGVSMPFYAKVMADMFEKLVERFPDVRDDLQVYCSICTFNSMFDQTKTIAFPDVSDAEFEDKVCHWNKQKEIRRGFGIFATELHIRGLVSEDLIHDALVSAMSDLEENVRKPANRLLSESIDQVVTFMFEVSKLLGTENGVIVNEAKKIAAIPRTESPSLGMRSRFKLEDLTRS